MKSIFLLIFFVILNACTDDPPKKTDPPSAPEMVAQSAGSDTTEYEIMGIDAEVGPENRIHLLWEEHPQRRELKHFNIYRTEDPDGQINYEKIAQVDPVGIYLEDDFYHEYTDDNDIDTLKTFYYFVTAVNDDDKESSPSDTVWYRLIEKARLISPLGSEYNDPDSVVFKWEFISQILPGGYILRIEDEHTDELVYVEWVQPIPHFDQYLRSHDLLNATLKSRFVSGRTYRWRIDSVERDPLHNGSESNWGTFKIYWGN